MLWLWTILLACGGDEAAPPADPAPRAERAEKAKAEADASAPRPGVDAPIPAASEPGAYGDKWLVILSSKEEAGFVPEGVDGLYKITTPPDPVRLDSSQFKGLMPCFEIVVAKAFDDWRGASDYVEALKRVDVDAYAKSAGAYVGEDPRLVDYCAAPEPSSCGDVHLVREVDGHPWMSLSLDEALAERAAEDAPEPSHVGRDFSAWAARLSAENVGPYSKGQVWRWFNQGQDFQCAIEEFAVLTLGMPHFGYSQQEETPTGPGCGEPEIYARLVCDGGALGEGFAIQGAAPEWVDAVDYEQAPNLPAVAMAAAEADPGFVALREQAQAGADEAGAALDSEVVVDLYASGRRSLAMVGYRGWTGEGFDECGGEDVDVHGFSLVDLSGREPAVVVAPRRAEVEVRGIWYREGELEYALWSWPDETTIYSADGEATCGLAIQFCDCAC